MLTYIHLDKVDVVQRYNEIVHLKNMTQESYYDAVIGCLTIIKYEI